jgi:hypothetical protein
VFRILDKQVNTIFRDDYELRKQFVAGFPSVAAIKRDAAVYMVDTCALGVCPLNVLLSPI